jgi:hypothetical protein
MTAKKRRAKRSADRPRTFEEVRDANLADPFHAARIVCGRWASASMTRMARAMINGRARCSSIPTAKAAATG